MKSMFATEHKATTSLTCLYCPIILRKVQPRWHWQIPQNSTICLRLCLPKCRAPHLELVKLPLRKVLYESGDPMGHVYFPADAIISMQYVMEDGASAAISVVGNDGLMGVSLFMGGESTPSRAIVQSAGNAYRLLGQKLKTEFNRHGDLLQLMLRYTQALITQMAQTAVCNRHHTLTSNYVAGYCYLWTACQVTA